VPLIVSDSIGACENNFEQTNRSKINAAELRRIG